MNRLSSAVMILAGALALAACGGQDNLAERYPDATINETPSGLKYIIVTEGSGPAPQPGEVVSVHYTGSLDDGSVFDSSVERGEPFQFQVGVGDVIAGWDEGLLLMRVGGKAILIIPPDLGYGAGGYPPVIPPNVTLHFEVELLEIMGQ